MSECIASHTPAGNMPPYVSVNREDGGVSITVRSPSYRDASTGCDRCGDTAKIVLNPEEWVAFINQLARNSP